MFTRKEAALERQQGLLNKPVARVRHADTQCQVNYESNRLRQSLLQELAVKAL